MEKDEVLKAAIGANHRRVISVRMRLLEQSCLRLLEMFTDVDATLTSRRGLPREKAPRVERLVRELRARIAHISSDLRLERARQDAAREAGALVAAMITNAEELHPDYLKGYGEVPDALAGYLQTHMAEVLRILGEVEEALGGPVTSLQQEG